VIEVGNIFKLGTRYSTPLGAVYLDEKGQEHPIVMGSYGIGPARIAAAAKDEAMRTVGEELYRQFVAAGVEVLYDDRDERAGVKFKDADLLGIPYRVTVGSRAIREGQIEIRNRRTREDTLVPIAETLPHVQALFTHAHRG
jgi:prolyl-tRNA synthetase